MGLHNDLLKRDEQDIAMDEIENIDLPFTTIMEMVKDRGYKISEGEHTQLQKLFDRMRKLAQYKQKPPVAEEEMNEQDSYQPRDDSDDVNYTYTNGARGSK